MKIKPTITSTFMVPTLIKKSRLNEHGFINGYIKDGKRDLHYENCVYLLFRPPNLSLFQEFANREPNVIDDYDYDGGFVVLVCSLNPKFERDFELIKQGKYSKTSLEFQETFPKVIKVIKNGKYKDEMTLQYQIFNKTDDLKEYWENKIGINFKNDMELWRGWNEELETLDIDKIREQWKHEDITKEN